MSIGPLVSIKRKGNSTCISGKTEICPFVHIHIKNFVTFTVHLIFLRIKITENNIVFQTTHHNFCILQFTEIGLHLSDSLINGASGDVQDFV